MAVLKRMQYNGGDKNINSNRLIFKNKNKSKEILLLVKINKCDLVVLF